MIPIGVIERYLITVTDSIIMGNYNQKKGTRFTITRPHSDEILIV